MLSTGSPQNDNVCCLSQILSIFLAVRPSLSTFLSSLGLSDHIFRISRVNRDSYTRIDKGSWALSPSLSLSIPTSPSTLNPNASNRHESNMKEIRPHYAGAAQTQTAIAGANLYSYTCSHVCASMCTSFSLIIEIACTTQLSGVAFCNTWPFLCLLPMYPYHCTPRHQTSNLERSSFFLSLFLTPQLYQNLTYIFKAAASSFFLSFLPSCT